MIKGISPTLLIFSILLPLILGLLGYRGRVPKCMGFFGFHIEVGVLLGWFIFVLAFLFQDIFSIMLALHFHGLTGVSEVTVDQPGTLPALLIGWSVGFIGYYIGVGVNMAVKGLKERLLG